MDQHRAAVDVDPRLELLMTVQSASDYRTILTEPIAARTSRLAYATWRVVV